MDNDAEAREQAEREKQAKADEKQIADIEKRKAENDSDRALALAERETAPYNSTLDKLRRGADEATGSGSV